MFQIGNASNESEGGADRFGNDLVPTNLSRFKVFHKRPDIHYLEVTKLGGRSLIIWTEFLWKDQLNRQHRHLPLLTALRADEISLKQKKL
jgi:hypothetical protein